MPSFNQIISPNRQFIIAVKVFRPTQREFDYNESIQSADNYHALVDTHLSPSYSVLLMEDCFLVGVHATHNCYGFSMFE